MISYILSSMLSVQSFCHRSYNDFAVECRILNVCHHGNKGWTGENFRDNVKLADAENHRSDGRICDVTVTHFYLLVSK